MSARKVMLLGEIGVGKSSIVQRLVFDRFDHSYKPTIGVDVYRYELPDPVSGPGRVLIVWDTDGNFGDAMFRHVYMKEASAALIVGDLTRPGTLQTMIRLGEGFRDAMPGRHCCYVLNKMDLVENQSLVDIPEAALSPGQAHALTSAKTGANVADAFAETARAIQRRGQ